jgi:hypothetical protein
MAAAAVVWVEWAAWAVWTCKNLPGGAAALLRSLAVQTVLSARTRRAATPPDQVFLLDPQFESKTTPLYGGVVFLLFPPRLI